MFAKAGEPGWAALIPIYNTILILKMAGKPWWWLFLTFIPIVGIIIAIMVAINVAANFGKGVGFGIGLVLLSPIFVAILGFGDAQYRPVAR